MTLDSVRGRDEKQVSVRVRRSGGEMKPCLPDHAFAGMPVTGNGETRAKKEIAFACEPGVYAPQMNVAEQGPHKTDLPISAIGYAKSHADLWNFPGNDMDLITRKATNE